MQGLRVSVGGRAERSDRRSGQDCCLAAVIRRAGGMSGWMSLREVAVATGRAHSTVRRHLDAGDFPNARRDPSWMGQPDRAPWQIPLEDLERAGLRIVVSGSWADEPGVLRYRIGLLEAELSLERLRRVEAEAVAAERAAVIAALVARITVVGGDL